MHDIIRTATFLLGTVEVAFAVYTGRSGSIRDTSMNRVSLRSL